MQGDLLDPVTGRNPNVYVNDFQIDLPYDHSYLVENLIDPAHIDISHDRTQGGGRRENAQAYEMVVDPDTVNARGFAGRFRFAAAKANGGPWTELKFEAPGIIRQYGKPRPGIAFGAALHCMPLSLGRSRLLFRVYVGGLPRLARALIQLKPKAFRDLNSCKILEQDVGLITTQEDHFARRRSNGKNRGAPADDYLLLKSSDRFVGEYRQWLDRVGHGMPWFQGLSGQSTNVASHLTTGATELLPPSLHPAQHRSSGQDCVETRYHRHVMHCPSTRQMLQRVHWLQRVAAVGSVAALTLSITLQVILGRAAAAAAASQHPSQRVLSVVATASIPFLTGSFALLRRLERSFYVSFKRRDQLRTETGL